MLRGPNLERHIRILTGFFILGLVLSGATAIPLQREVDWLVKVVGAGKPTGTASPLGGASSRTMWLLKVQSALHETSDRHPFLFYGTDWLAFGHFVIAIAFVGALRDPVRNRWLFDFGLVACGLVIPYALVFGTLRGIPVWWRLMDCAFGAIGSIPLWFCRNWSRQLEAGVDPTYKSTSS